jgi:glycosyltransferase involved in cell wall biosynthesis
MNREKVTIGIPTYNRPIGLKRTLESIINQTYTNLEIIVSDNCSPDKETDKLMEYYLNKDTRIKYFKQDVNKGIIHNFHFVKDQATSNYFMWATDDDYYENMNLVETLMKFSPENILTFTNYNFVSADKTIPNFFTPIYKSCNNKLDYVYTLCKNGWGHPSCGLYNLKLAKKNGVKIKVEEDLSYHMEGLLLHKIFDTGLIKYVDEVTINFNTKSRQKESIIEKKRIEDFLIYTKSLIIFYLLKSNNAIGNKINILKMLTQIQFKYYNKLLIQELPLNKWQLIKFIFKTLLYKRN